MLRFREATIDDAKLYFEWVNDVEIRKSAFQSNSIEQSSHIEWFKAKLENENVLLLVCCFQEILIGQVRIDINFKNHQGLIDYSIDKNTNLISITPCFIRTIKPKYF